MNAPCRIARARQQEVVPAARCIQRPGLCEARLRVRWPELRRPHLEMVDIGDRLYSQPVARAGRATHHHAQLEILVSNTHQRMETARTLEPPIEPIGTV